jgi:hypothetical protein
VAVDVRRTYFAFYDPDYALRRCCAVSLGRLPANMRRSTCKSSARPMPAQYAMWSKVENDPDYRALARSVWAQDSSRSETRRPRSSRK